MGSVNGWEALAPFRLLVVPGLHDSAAGHWQSRWQRLYSVMERKGMERVRQGDWDDPQLDAWSARVDQQRALDRRPTLFIAHSFGCLATVASISRDPAHVAGLLLVAPAAPEKFGVAGLLPQSTLPCPSTVIASSNDPWMMQPAAALWARRWGSDFIDAGALGHINAESGLGDWPAGQHYLCTLAQRAAQGLR